MIMKPFTPKNGGKGFMIMDATGLAGDKKGSLGL